MSDDECKCFRLARERMAHEIASACLNLIEIAVGGFHPEGHVDPDEAMTVLAYIAADVIWRAGGGDDARMAQLLLGHAANVGRGIKVFSEADVASSVH